MSSYDPETDDPHFEEDFLASITAVLVASGWIVLRGNGIYIHGMECRDNVEDRHDFSDEGDMVIIGEDGEKTVDVKQRDLSFEGPEDYEYETVFVNKKYIHDDEDHDLYIIFDDDLSHCIIIDSETEDQWSIERKQDRGQRLKFYAAPFDVCTFKDVPRHIFQ